MKNHVKLRASARQVALNLVLVLAIIVIAAFVADGPSLSETDPAVRIEERTSRLVASGPYRPPSPNERQEAVTGFLLLLDEPPKIRRARAALIPLGFSTTTETDPATGRRYVMVANELGTSRAWGIVIIDLSAPPRLVIEVPHPKSDRRTEQLGLALFRRVPGSVLLIAGAHRRAAHGIADVAHQENSLFHALTVAFAARQLPQVQLHGFDNDSLEDTDIVISTGAAAVKQSARSVADNLDAAGLTICRAWLQDCGNLEGKKNVQGIATAKTNGIFIHVEANRTVREDQDKRAVVVEGIAGAFNTR